MMEKHNSVPHLIRQQKKDFLPVDEQRLSLKVLHDK